MSKKDKIWAVLDWYGTTVDKTVSKALKKGKTVKLKDDIARESKQIQRVIARLRQIWAGETGKGTAVASKQEIQVFEANGQTLVDMMDQAVSLAKKLETKEFNALSKQIFARLRMLASMQDSENATTYKKVLEHWRAYVNALVDRNSKLP